MSILNPPRPAHRPQTPRSAPPRRDRRARHRRGAGPRGRVGPARWLVDATRAHHHFEALTAIGASLAVGALGGWWMRSRWAMLLTPVMFAAVFESTRADTAGPLVDGIRLGGGGSFGILAFVLGRGLHAVLALLPMILGAALGAGLARRRHEGRPRTHGWARAGLDHPTRHRRRSPRWPCWR